MPRSRIDDESRQPILRDSNVNDENYHDNELLEEVTCCDPRAGWYRFIGLIFMCLVGFGRSSYLIKLCKVNFFPFSALFQFYDSALSSGLVESEEKSSSTIRQRKFHMFSFTDPYDCYYILQDHFSVMIIRAHSKITSNLIWI